MNLQIDAVPEEREMRFFIQILFSLVLLQCSNIFAQHDTIRSYYRNGVLKKETILKTSFGDQYKTETSFYRNGNRYSLINYKNGKWRGHVEIWYKTGRKQLSGYFVNGKIDGVDTLWSDNSKQVCIWHYKNDLPDGLYTEYYDGHKILEGNYADGKISGEWVYYNEDGTVKKRKLYH